MIIEVFITDPHTVHPRKLVARSHPFYKASNHNHTSITLPCKWRDKCQKWCNKIILRPQFLSQTQVTALQIKYTTINQNLSRYALMIPTTITKSEQHCYIIIFLQKEEHI